MSELFKFKGTIVRNIFNSENFKSYAVAVDRNKYPFIKFTKYGNVSVAGDVHSLSVGVEYNFTCEEKVSDKYGTSYMIKNISKDRPKSEDEVFNFLKEIVTFNQATELFREYPNIIDLVLEGNDDKIDLSKLKGIGEYTFNNIIKPKIIENYALFDLVAEYGGVLSISIIKKLYTYYTSIEKIRTELRFRPYSCLTRISRIGFKSADALLLDLEKEGKVQFEEPLRESKERCLACICYLLEENENNGNTKAKLTEVRAQLLKLVPKCAHHFVECLKENGNLIYYNKETLDMALTRTYNTELAISEYIKDALKKKNVWDIDWKPYQDEGEFKLTDEQADVLKKVCEETIVSLVGNAGSGKSASTNKLIQMLRDNNLSFELVASTGRAAKVLSEYTNMPARTIHRGYGYNPSCVEYDGWGINVDNKINTDIVICDEFSMVDIFLFKRLLDGIDFNKTKLLVIGDDAQACSVACGNCLHDILDSNVVPTVKLTKIFRYGEGGLLTVATDVRNGKTFLSDDTKGLSQFGANNDYAFLQCSDENIVKNCVAIYNKALSKYNMEDILVLSAQNKGDYGTVAINKQLQKVANSKNFGSENNIKVGDITYYVDDLVIQCVNNYKAKLANEQLFSLEEEEGRDGVLIANGEIGKIKSIGRDNNGQFMIIDFDGTEVIYHNESIQAINLAYVISIHKSQGGGAKCVILLTPKAHTFMNTQNLLYVGLTRTKEQCYHLGNIKTVNGSIRKREHFNRSTFLGDMLLDA